MTDRIDVPPPSHDRPMELSHLRGRIAMGELSDQPLPDPLPTTGERAGGEPVPDLSRLEPEQWCTALKTVGRRAHWAAVKSLPDVDEQHVVQSLVMRLPAVAKRPVRGDALDDPDVFPAPDVPADRHGRRQVNFRLTAREHERLVDAAQRLGLTPTALARSFCVSGTNRALSED